MKIILFLLLLYFCNTDNTCNFNSLSGGKAQDCYSRTVNNSEENYCCYAVITVPANEDPLGPICIELPKSYSSKEKEDSIKDSYSAYTISDIKVQCPGERNGATNTPNSPSYLKIGFLFILSLLF